jgi:hypothetical protein
MTRPTRARVCTSWSTALLVSPPPRLEHDDAASALDRLIAPLLPVDLRVGIHRGVLFDRRHHRHPDVAVWSRAAARAKGRIEAADVLLAVEVVSPSSVSTDRVTNPAQCAAAGIAHSWRLQLDPLLLVVHELSDGTYRARRASTTWSTSSVRRRRGSGWGPCRTDPSSTVRPARVVRRRDVPGLPGARCLRRRPGAGPAGSRPGCPPPDGGGAGRARRAVGLRRRRVVAAAVMGTVPSQEPVPSALSSSTGP